MKNIMLCILLSLAAFNVPAQRLYTGERHISFSVGLQDNFFLQKKDNAGFFASLCYSWINKQKNRWILGANSSVKYYDYMGAFTPVSQYVVDIGYYMPFIKNYRKNWIISFGLGANAGYEVIRSPKGGVFKNGAAIAANNRWLYGGFIGLENELYLFNNMIWILYFKERYLNGSDITNTHSNFGTGFKFSIKN